jgi:hypothetical protein
MATLCRRAPLQSVTRVVRVLGRAGFGITYERALPMQTNCSLSEEVFTTDCLRSWLGLHDSGRLRSLRDDATHVLVRRACSLGAAPTIRARCRTP